MWQNNIAGSDLYFGHQNNYQYPNAEFGFDGTYETNSMTEFSSSYAQSSAAPSEFEYSSTRRQRVTQPSARGLKASRRESIQSIATSNNQYPDNGYFTNNVSPGMDMDAFAQPFSTNGQDFYTNFAGTEQSIPASPNAFSDGETSSSSNDSTPARNHPLYTAYPHEDGLYHCPFVDSERCGHEPKTLKCEYDKYIDSHLKPFRCKHAKCAEHKFSSTACLLRHEREAHEMHGHNESLCEYPPCNRSVPGNGFRRSYNCKDHMTRCHGWIDQSPAETKTKRRATSSTKSSGVTKSKQKKHHVQLLSQQFAEHKACLAELNGSLDPMDPSFAMILTKITGEAQMLKTIQSEINKIQGRG